MVRDSRTLGLLCASAAAALSGCDKEDGQSRALTSWLGEETHLAVKGTFQEKSFDVLLEGDDAGIYCERFYTPLPGNTPDSNGSYDTAQLYFAMKEIGAVIELEGQPTQFTISYWRHDLPTNSTLEVIPRTFGTTIPAGKTWSDVNIFPPGTDVLSGIESAAESGTINIELNEGEPDPNGVMIPEGGRTGLFVDVSWGPGDWLTVSGSAECRPATMAPWAESRILP